VYSRDRDFRPNRRRSFDDDNYAPPRNTGFAPRASSPQFETPSGPAMRATVKWYSHEKGFGFVTLEDGTDAFLHVSVVERSGNKTVLPGSTVEVRTSPGPKGLQVTEVISVDTSTALQEPPRRPRPERPDAFSSVGQATVEEYGTVKFYDANKGFGFILRDLGGKDVFVHVSILSRVGLDTLADGQRVVMDVAEGRKGLEAVNVRIV
jgi:CspA family cold shock protein